MVNEYNEEEFYDDLFLPINIFVEKRVLGELFHRTEEKKVALISGINMARPPAKPYIFQEFPHTMFHRRLGECIVYNKEEEKARLDEGWQLTPAKIKREEFILQRIPELEKELSDLIYEFQEITGKDYEEELAKIRRREEKE